MDEGSARVRQIQTHLRSAAARLAEHRPEEALQDVDAALAIDSGSLAAQSLRTRIEAQLAASTSPRTAQSDVDDVAPAPHVRSAERYVPPGVEANIWIGFEQRIQDRRFRALLEAVRTALDRGDGIGARVALEEARELRPDASELDAISSQVARLPMASAVTPARRSPWMRVAGAVLLLLAGMSLLIGFERLNEPQRFDQMGSPQEPQIAVPGEAEAPLPPPVAAAPQPGPILSALSEPVGTSGPVAPTATGTAASIASLSPDPERPGPRRPLETRQGSATPRLPLSDTEQLPSVTSSIARTRTPQPTGPPAPEVPPRPSPSSGAAPLPASEPPSPIDRPLVASATPEASSSVTASAPEPAAGESIDIADEVLPAVSAPPPAVVEVPETAARTVVGPRDDREIVEQVLNQYARRYTQLDAAGLRGVWPSAPERDLARAFADLESQTVAFEACSIDVQGAAANASCRGSQRFVTRIGSREPRTEDRLWTFVLRRDGGEWKIQEARVAPR